MQRASDLFDDEQRKHIETAVAEAEAKTSCEIVPVVATVSGRYDRPEDMVGLWMAILAAIIVWLVFPRQSNESGSWDGVPAYLGLLAMVAGIVISFIAGVVLGSRIGWVRRLFTPRNQMQEEVAARAREIFFDQRVHHTSQATGMLIYVSLFEHMAVVLGDQNVLDSLGQECLNRLCQQLSEGLHQGDATEAICSTITEAGQQLSGPLPRADVDVNELQNTLVLIDGPFSSFAADR